MIPTLSPAERWPALSERQRDLAVYCFYCALSLVVAWPVLVAPATRLCASHGDSLLTVFWFWWFKTAWTRGIPANPSPMVAAPFGVDWADLFEKGNSWPGMLLSKLVNETLAFNVLVLISFPLAAIAAYHLSLYLVRNRTAAAISGVIYSFAPFHLWKSWAWVPLANTQWIAFYCLALLRWRRRQTLRSAVAAGFCLALVDFFSHIYFLIAVVLTLIFLYCWAGHSLVVSPRIRIRSGLLLQACAAAGTALILLLPIIYPIIFTYLRQGPAGAPAKYSWPLSELYGLAARWSDYLLPPESSRLYPLFAAWQGPPTPRGGYTNGLFLGFTALLLSAVAARSILAPRHHLPRERFAPLFFLVLLLSAGLLSLLPPAWSVGLSEAGRNLTLRGPAYFLHLVAPWFREFARFGILVLLSVAVLASYGLDYLMVNWPSERKLLIALVACGLCVDYSFRFPAGFPIDTGQFPEVYRWLAAQPGDFSIAEYPEPRSSQVSPAYLLYVTMHGKRLVNGHGMSRTMDLISPAFWEIGEPQAAGVLSYLGARYVVWHASWPGFERWFGTRPQALPAEGDLELVKKFDTATVFRVRAAPARIIVAPGEGFDLFSDPGRESAWWWLQGSGSLQLINVTGQTQSVLLRMQTKRLGNGGDIWAVTVEGNKVGVISPAASPESELVIGPLSVPPSHLGESRSPVITRLLLGASMKAGDGLGVRRLQAVILTR